MFESLALDADRLEYLFALRDECDAGPDGPLFDTAEVAGFCGQDPLTQIARYSRSTASLQGTGLRATAEFVRAQPDGPESAEAEVSLVLGLSAPAGSSFVELALSLSSRLPATLAALEDGEITLASAKVLLDETENLTIAQAGRVEREVLPKAKGRSSGSLRRMARRRVLAIDADAAWKRRVREVQKRDVTVSHGTDAMANLNAYLTAEDALAVFGVIDTFAHGAKTPGDQRPIGARRADALVDLILNPGKQKPRVKYVVHLHAPTGNGAGEPGVGELTGHGPIPVQLIHDLAAGVDRTDLDTHPDRYRPGARLEAAVKARDGHCRFPGCRIPAWRTDLDHVIAFPIGGRTVYLNLAATCRRHHRIKHLPGWAVRMGPGGVLTWTTPQGRTYITHPPRPCSDDPPELAEAPAAAPTEPNDDVPPF